jgi:hypothetical protein
MNSKVRLGAHMNLGRRRRLKNQRHEVEKAPYKQDVIPQAGCFRARDGGQFQSYKRMQRVQREVVMAHLALMHMAASDISLLELATKPEEGSPFNRKRLKRKFEELAAQGPISLSFPLARSSLGKHSHTRW